MGKSSILLVLKQLEIDRRRYQNDLDVLKQAKEELLSPEMVQQINHFISDIVDKIDAIDDRIEKLRKLKKMFE